MLQDLIAGQVDMAFDGLGSSAGHIKAGRLVPLAVAAEKRTAAFPDVPTAAEMGMPDYKVSTWYGLWAPKGTPQAIVERMAAELKKALNTPEIKETWAGLGTETPDLWGEAYGKFVSGEIRRWAEVVKASGAKLD
jgi:tripartite-type tricarboxylate transporter receptor subunit TctC